MPIASSGQPTRPQPGADTLRRRSLGLLRENLPLNRNSVLILAAGRNLGWESRTRGKSPRIYSTTISKSIGFLATAPLLSIGTGKSEVGKQEKCARTGSRSGQTERITLPNCDPDSRYACAAAASASGKIRSNTGLNLPAATNFSTVCSSDFVPI
jgi:hypothetical protein